MAPSCALAPPSSSAASASINKPSTGTIRLTPSEIEQHKKDGKCLYCNELFTDGYKLICKQLFSIEVVDDDGSTPDAAEPSQQFPFMCSSASNPSQGAR
jgi:hypothetical protein